MLKRQQQTKYLDFKCMYNNVNMKFHSEKLIEMTLGYTKMRLPNLVDHDTLHEVT